MHTKDTNKRICLKDQESYKLNTFVEANVLLIMEEEDSVISIGDKAKLLKIKN